MGKKHFFLIVFLTAFISFEGIYAQTDEQKELEARKERLQEEIQQFNTLLSQKRKEKTNVLEDVEDLDHKIKIRKELIKVTNQQTDLIQRQINNNINKISKLRDDLKELKADYAEMIRKSYKSSSQQSRLMFLLSSENFLQAYKRLQYMKQYANYRKEQAAEIQAKTKELQQLNDGLVVQREEKENLIAENRKEQESLERELNTQKGLIASIKEKEEEYASQIRQKQRQADEIDRQIDRLIKEAIAKANAANKETTAETRENATKSSNFALTAEAKLVDADFVANKGKLPWPVEKGVIKMRYGKQPHPVVKSVTIQSNGVRIATEKGARARAIYRGKVLAVQAIKGGNKAVLIQHGNYISVYNNLGKVYVKEGDNVVTKQEIGEVFTSPSNNETVLKFMIYDNNHTDNPANWIYRM
ncbi:murein hydrolase activator EnvC family protein [Galbibacter pacificus]|uniref:Peptidoglycan DD-metalloendopeptidase family protein n=1 Tax=Galbibacter pacificus TaxID=2996052 RepID=A0ABT6FU59_9FLAO|nr:peptidoglycan DD-metalloendopeptidase family protein [Galbibacter pacificus]MDG3583318.1 peptidoglycan DD-metalloendopeptidase family protein [Galbibacter pacificus]MDG3586799.1 peptidoglycan DD-metalloendopeptidase family protein [Galbibacter pacificus]